MHTRLSRAYLALARLSCFRICDKKHDYLFPAVNTVAALTNDLSTLFATTFVERACKKSNNAQISIACLLTGCDIKKSPPREILRKEKY